ncbi:unnamed protein product [Closterium sp. NIES-53]
MTAYLAGWLHARSHWSRSQQPAHRRHRHRHRHRHRRQLDGLEALPSQSHPARPFPSTRPSSWARAGDEAGGRGAQRRRVLCQLDAARHAAGRGDQQRPRAGAWEARAGVWGGGTTTGWVEMDERVLLAPRILPLLIRRRETL